MANEITVTVGLKVVNGNLSINPPTKTKQFNQSTARGGGPGVVSVGTTEETISFGDISPGYVMMQNLDDTNFVDFGNATGDLDYTLEAGGGLALVKMKSGTTLYMKADTASCDVLIQAVNL